MQVYNAKRCTNAYTKLEKMENKMLIALNWTLKHETECYDAINFVKDL